MNDDDYDRRLQELETHEFENGEAIGFFDLHAYILGDEDEPLTEEQARGFAGALMRSREWTREHITILVKDLPIEVIRHFLLWIRSNTSLFRVSVSYTEDEEHPYDIGEAEEQTLNEVTDEIFLALRDNPSIQEFRAGMYGNPESIRQVLAYSKSLKNFIASDLSDLSPEMATAIADGMSKSSSLKWVSISPSIGHLHIILPGLYKSSVESLFISSFVDGTFLDLDAVSRLLLNTSKLEKLCICHHGFVDLHKILSSLGKSACTNLKELLLEGLPLVARVPLVARAETYADANGAIMGVVSNPNVQANTSLTSLTLRDVSFRSPSAVRFLWYITGLLELSISSDTTVPAGAMHDQEAVRAEGYWAEFIRRNDKLKKAIIRDRSEAFTCIKGVLEGARNHPSLKELEVGFGRNNPESRHFLGARIVGQVLPGLSLTSLSFGGIFLQAGGMAAILRGLEQQNPSTLKTLIFDTCNLNTPALTNLGQALESPNVLVRDVGFPRSTASREGMVAFLQSLSRMPNIRAITVHELMTTLVHDAQLVQLLLHAAQENSNLCELNDFTGVPYPDYNDQVTTAELNLVHYYLKLNRFGRRILDSPNVPPRSLWPMLLSRMASQPDDVDALFYFLVAKLESLLA